MAALSEPRRSKVSTMRLCDESTGLCHIPLCASYIPTTAVLIQPTTVRRPDEAVHGLHPSARSQAAPGPGTDRWSPIFAVMWSTVGWDYVAALPSKRAPRRISQRSLRKTARITTSWSRLTSMAMRPQPSAGPACSTKRPDLSFDKFFSKATSCQVAASGIACLRAMVKRPLKQRQQRIESGARSDSCQGGAARSGKAIQY